jgi:hypothetical protein
MTTTEIIIMIITMTILCLQKPASEKEILIVHPVSGMANSELAIKWHNFPSIIYVIGF